MIPMLSEICLLVYLICADHLRLLSMITPRNFVSFFNLQYFGLVYDNNDTNLRHEQYKISYVNV